MNLPSERRDTRRIYVGPEHTIHFVVKGHVFREVRITNLSLGGCFAMVAYNDAGLFAQGTVLEQLGFNHPGLPVGAITGQVRYVVGGQEGAVGLEFMGVGIHFSAVPEATQAQLNGFLGAAAT